MPAETRRTPPVFVQPFVEEGLGNTAYLVGARDSKVAALIDPLRDVDRYLEAADGLGVKVAFALDTHLHNDFVSGSREIAARTGAIVGASAEAGLTFDHRPLKDGDTLPLGSLSLGVLATPGHTPEHIAYAIGDAPGSPPLAVFTGGALIVGGAARTDLLGQETAVPLARNLYHTIHDRLLKLADGTAILPTHGAGSFCAAPAYPERTTTIGRERVRNPLCKPQSEEEFVRRALQGLGSYPAYFGKLRPVNQEGPAVLGGLPEPSPLSAADVNAWVQGGGVVLDLRSPPEFLQSHVPGAYGLWGEYHLATWAGWLLPFRAPLVLVADAAEDRQEAVRELIQIGFDDFRGYLEGGIGAWKAAGLPVESFPSISASELRERIRGGAGPLVLDVRQDDEWVDGHIPGAVHIENGRLPWDDLDLPKDRPIVVHCGSQNRSPAGMSVLARRGFRNLTLLRGGFSGWARSGFEIEPGDPS